MKQGIYAVVITTCFLLLTQFLFAQGLSVNTTGTAANASAILDASSTTQGELVPRMDSAQRVAIIAPANGLLVYQTDGVTPGFYNYNGTAWQKVGATVQPHVQVYTTPGSYTFTTSANITTASVFKITLIGGGGGGGSTGFDPTYGGGGGGGAGAIAIYWGAGLSPNTAYSVIVGVGGEGGFPPDNGYAGGTSSITLASGTISCPGGGGGAVGISGSGGSGGSSSLATGGTLNAGGGAGSPGAYSGFDDGIGGNGCSSTYGAGGVGCSPSTPSGYGSGSGSGGGGGGTYFPFGGNGAPGIAIIEWSE